MQVSFSPEGRAEKYEERAGLRSGKAVAGSAEETRGCEFRAFCEKKKKKKTLRNHSELQADKQASY